MARPIFTDEVLGANGGVQTAQYDIIQDGAVSAQNVSLTLKNPITTPGTPLNAANMNNLFMFDNLISVSGSTYNTTGLGTSTITETIIDTTSGILIAKRRSAKGSNSNWTITETLYGSDGATVIQSRKIQYTKNGSQWTGVIS
jgi:hypothetical protein